MWMVVAIGLYAFVFLWLIVGVWDGFARWWREMGRDAPMPMRRLPWHESAAYKAEFARVRPVVLARDGHRCRECGRGGTLHIHHVVPRARGGSNAASNLVSLCPTHHAMRHSHYLARRRR